MTKQYIDKNLWYWLSETVPIHIVPNQYMELVVWKIYVEESISNDCNSYSDNICFVISNLWNDRYKYINNDYSVTGWMLCVISHIREDVFKNAQNNHHIQVNTVINSLFIGSTEKELYETLDTFWSKYTNFNHKNDPFDSNEFIWNSKDISDVNSHIWHHKYSLPSNRVLGFVDCRLTSIIPWIGSAERSWGNVKTIISGKRSALGSEISDEHSIMYASTCIEEAMIGSNLSHTYSKNGSHSHSWNDEYHAYDYQLYQWGVERLFQNSDELIIR